MGLFDILKRKTPIEKAIHQLRQPFSQPEYRREAMDKLLEMATEESYKALLIRFTFNANGQIADEQEKRYLVDRLIEIGQPALSPLEAYIQTEKSIAFPIRALTGILSKEDAVAFLIETLRRYEPLDHRTTQAKTSLILGISDLAGPDSAEAIVPYLDDHHDDVQFQVIDTLEMLANEEATRVALCNVCMGEAHSGRIQRRAAQALVNLKWSARGHFKDFNAELKVEYILGKKGVLVKKQTSTNDEAE